MTHKNKSAHLNIRDIPRATLNQLKMAAIIEGKTIKKLVLELIQDKIDDLQRKGRLPNQKA